MLKTDEIDINLGISRISKKDIEYLSRNIFLVDIYRKISTKGDIYLIKYLVSIDMYPQLFINKVKNSVD